MCPFGRLDPVAPAPDGRQVEVLGRVDGYLVSADRAPEDDAKRIEDVRDARRGEALAPQAVDEVLDIAPLDLRQLPGSERRDDTRGAAARSRARSTAFTA